ncbi:MAG: hypothetical protein HY363_03385 [Candidatus Aenigmarchaeota archaeon]|nr:hypothetical protein [Candidatus Aenigmarchaeota archaeon]
MGALKEIFDKLNSPYCRYSENKPFETAIPGGGLEKLASTESLEFLVKHPREYLLVLSFESEPTRIIYAGEDINAMRETVEKLRIPNSWPTNIGEKAFYLFRGELKTLDAGPAYFEVSFNHGKEQQLSFVLKKLLEIYENDAEKSANANHAANLHLLGGTLSCF